MVSCSSIKINLTGEHIPQPLSLFAIYPCSSHWKCKNDMKCGEMNTDHGEPELACNCKLGIDLKNMQPTCHIPNAIPTNPMVAPMSNLPVCCHNPLICCYQYGQFAVPSLPAPLLFFLGKLCATVSNVG